jgi:hypothetical protein
MNDGNHAVADDGGSKMALEGQTDDAALSGTGQGSVSPDRAVPGAIPPVDLARAPVAVRLRAAREALGLSAGEVAKRTRITLRHIEALEAGDYAAMPGRPYAIGFARGYARAVELDGTVISDAVRAELQGSAPRPEPRVLHQFEVGDPAKTPSRMVVWLALLLVGAILAMGGVFWRSYYAPAVSLPLLAGPEEARTAEQRHPQAKVPSAGPAQAPVNGPVVFTALEDGIWAKFYDGQGKQLMQKQLAKGESYTIPAEAVSPKLWTGRPDALAITIGGQAIPRLADGEKIVKDVPVDAASLRGRAQAAAPAPRTP